MENKNLEELVKENDLSKKVKEIINYIQKSYYVNSSNMNIDGEKYNDVCLFSVITGLVDGNELIIGNPGIGKTTSAEAVLSTIYSLPVEIYRDAKLKGHPEQTEEKMIGRPHMGELNKGNEKVIWSAFVINYGKIIDEINRLPEGKQSELLDSIDRGVFTYLNETFPRSKKEPFFATANYQDRGNTELLPALKDRFDIIVEATFSEYAEGIAEGKNEGEKKKISNPEIKKKLEDILKKQDEDYEEKINELREEFYKNVEDKNIVLYPSELEKIKEEISKIELSEYARNFLTYFNLSLYNPYTGEYRPGEQMPEDNHYKGYPCGRIKRLSQRAFNSIVKYAKGIAWLRDHKEVEIDDVLKVLPYTLAHRVEFDEEYLQDMAMERNKPENYNKRFLNLFASKMFTKEVFGRFEENKEEIEHAFYLANNGKVDELKKLANERDDPFYKALYGTFVVEE